MAKLWGRLCCQTISIETFDLRNPKPQQERVDAVRRVVMVLFFPYRYEEFLSTFLGKKHQSHCVVGGGEREEEQAFFIHHKRP